MENVYIGYRFQNKKGLLSIPLHAKSTTTTKPTIFCSRFQTIATKPMKHWSIILKMSTETFEAYIQQHFIGLLIFSGKSTLIKLCT